MTAMTAIKRSGKVMMLAIILSITSLSAHAQTITPQMKAMAMRAAEVDAYRQLASQVMGIQLSGATQVKDFLEVDDRIGASMDQFIKGVRFTNRQFYPDGMAQVEAEVTIQQVVTELKKSYDAYYKGNKWTTKQIEEITKTYEKSVITAVGAGAAEDGTKVESASSISIIKTTIMQSSSHMINLPSIYPRLQRVTAADKIRARRSAELDAYRQLAERIYGLEISAGSRVKDFVAASDVIRSRMNTFLKGVRITAIRDYDDGTAEADAEVTIEQIVKTLEKARDTVFQDGRWKDVDLSTITKRQISKVIKVTGAGAARAEVAVRLTARRAAELDAYRKLLERIQGVQITENTTVKNFVADNSDVRAAMEGTLKGARIANVRYRDDGLVEVEAQLTIQQVIKALKTVNDDYYKDGRWTSQQFTDIEKKTTRKVISVIGQGALPTKATGEGRRTGTTTIYESEDVIIIE